MTTTPQDNGLREQIENQVLIAMECAKAGDMLLDLKENTAASILHIITAQREQDRLSADYQIHVYPCNDKFGLWGLRIAHEGRQVYGNFYETEQQARDAVPEVMTQLQRLKAGGTTGRDGDD